MGMGRSFWTWKKGQTGSIQTALSTITKKIELDGNQNPNSQVQQNELPCCHCIQIEVYKEKTQQV